MGQELTTEASQWVASTKVVKSEVLSTTRLGREPQRLKARL